MISYDWLRRFFPHRARFSTDNTRVPRERIRDRNINDFYREFDEMRRDMEKIFSEQLKDFETKVPQDLVKEYETSDGRKFREIGPIVYGYSMNLGPDGVPRKENLVM